MSGLYTRKTVRVLRDWQCATPLKCVLRKPQCSNPALHGPNNVTKAALIQELENSCPSSASEEKSYRFTYEDMNIGMGC